MPKRKAISLLSIAILTMFLAGCATAPSKGCPPLVTYSKAYLLATDAELKKLPRDGRVAEMIVDYSKLRDACRVK